MKDTFLTVKELSEYISVKPKTLYSWVAKKAIPFYRLQGVLRFKKCEIDYWLKNKCKDVEGAFSL